MKKLVFLILVTILTVVFSYNVFAFTFVEEGFPKEPDHNLKWIMIDVNGQKYYFETVKEIDLDLLDFEGHIYFDSGVLNDGKSIIIYNYDNSEGKWKSMSVSKQIIELGRKYKVLYTNYNISGEFFMFQPYLRFLLNCLNLSDILTFCIMMYAVIITIGFVNKKGWLL